MLHERGRVVAVEHDALWVETIRQSVCGSCAAKQGCGQRLLAGLGGQPSYLRVLLSDDGTIKYSVGDSITIGIPETAVVKASLIIYLLPLMVFVFFTGSVHLLFYNELLSIIAGVSGLIAGGILVRIYTFFQRQNTDFQPQVIE